MEIERLPRLQSDEERYFDRLGDQVNRLVDATDAAENGMATVIDLRLNETSYLLTVVATIFLPLTFITGFFGMNFDWMIAQIDTQLAFWVAGSGHVPSGGAAGVAPDRRADRRSKRTWRSRTPPTPRDPSR